MKKRILIICGDDTIRHELSNALRSENIEVYFANSTDDAKSRFEGAVFSLIIIDFRDSIIFHTDMEMMLQKPVSVEICAEKARLLLRQVKNTSINFGDDLVIDLQHHSVFVNGNQLFLTRKEFELLQFLAENPEQVLSRRQLYEQVWSDKPMEGSEATVKAHIATLRKKLASAGKAEYIQNVWGVGYRFVPPQTL